jgi:adenine-specific DNA-methyltransferase
LKPIEVTDPLAHSADLTAEKIDQLRQLFPEAITEDASGHKVDFDVLRGLLGASVSDGDEKYGLNWHGKRAARRLALTPSTGTLRPSPEDSVDWDTTQNLMIEGDNLEVLKLLQKSYAGKIKMIYIDPPYNTGKDFVYKDDFKDSIANYQRVTGQRDEEGTKLTTNSESSGRFHTDWLNMMYPRLLLARNLLREDGVIFVSVDDNEQANLQELLSEVFGSQNFASCFVVKSNPRGSQSTAMSANVHEYVACYVRSAHEIEALALPLEERMIDEYSKEDQDGRYRLLGLRQRGGFWRQSDRPLLHYPLYVSEADSTVSTKKSESHTIPVKPFQPTTGEPGTWRWGAKKAEVSAALLIARKVGRDGGEVWDIFQKDYLTDAGGIEKGTKPRTIWDEKEMNTQNGTTEVKELFGGLEVFDFPKPVELVQKTLSIGTEGGEEEIVLDFFAGSGTTGHAAMKSNAQVQKNLRYILVQLPEPLNESLQKGISGRKLLSSLNKPLNIAELTKERLRRAAAKLKSENPLFHGDLGFRIFKLDTTSVRPWDPNLPVSAESLPGLIENILPGRTESDLLYELLLKRGLGLTVPIEAKQIAGKQVYAVGAGTLIACLAPSIAAGDVEALSDGIIAWHKQLAPSPAPNPETPKAKTPKFESPLVVFRDNAFVDDVAKSNLTEILKQHGLTDVRSL